MWRAHAVRMAGPELDCAEFRAAHCCPGLILVVSRNARAFREGASVNTHTGIVLHPERMQAGWTDGRTLLMDEAMTAPCAAAPATLLVVDDDDNLLRMLRRGWRSLATRCQSRPEA